MSDEISASDGAQAKARDEPAWLAEAVEAAHLVGCDRFDAYDAIRAALPIIREHIAREIEIAADVRLNDNTPDEYGTAFWNGLEDGYEEAAHVARGAL